MLDDISETKATMQADELEAVICKKVEFPSEMTFKSEDLNHSIIKEEPQVEELSSEIDSIRYKGINLEDDIEKVEVTSHDSSEETEDFENTPSPKEDDQNVFSQIPTQSPNESIKSWLQRITEVQSEMQKKYFSELGNSGPIASNSALNSSSSLTNSSTSTSQNSSRVVKYQDLPYMGEMTLDNSKPRRGRKPKKADICHLIYKNYGTIFPGTPNPGNYLEKDPNLFKKSALVDSNKEDSLNRSDVQNRIISSLLEKRLTQEFSRTKDIKKSSKEDKSNQDEPLNLCIRDLNHLKIRLLKKNDNTYTSEIKSEPHSDDDVELIQESPSPSSSVIEPRFPTSDGTLPIEPIVKAVDGVPGPGGYVYWSNAGVFIHPIALQQQLMMYQRMAAGNNYVLPNNHSPKPPSEANSSSSKDHGVNELRKMVPRVIKPKPSSPKVNHEEAVSPMQAPDTKKRNASHPENHKSPTKRKRSAIFIPPIPPENNTNPATEVSICKFKFTGGAKPSLQEKKMLSVDSGGNFRYYSGTGDKSMRGYEFFPRETLQQQVNTTHGSSTGAFLQASGEKIYPTPPPDFPGAKTSSEFLMSPEIPAATFTTAQSSSQDHSQRMKKRKSRKSLQREKLEQTFKEKGFLIQTQQTESAEGATYCKFRQLRKFTRYLFRSWKDYLPGNIADGEQQQQQQAKSSLGDANELSIDNADDISVHSSEFSNV
ncbi:uncharacterized protein LOC126885696 isoform X2 [Diabrotica virgifera virgifera]|uniref:Uncharacterized protein n=2 Tax=Diabrotica virgifera virgifera TaxID=50390 RepID=A0ABM5KDX3_DIAVI|nr:uncharacterized protein LOC126885696 isoform X1 [Diabrotica virgifera virgifera]XP_050508363.1 uncharacterized protein LOC126885696 isoform X2 [Diabrotica virgifera virgifera]